MPTWISGIGVAILLLIGPRIYGWLATFVRREIESLLRIPAEKKLQRDAAAWREAQRRAADEGPGSPTA